MLNIKKRLRKWFAISTNPHKSKNAQAEKAIVSIEHGMYSRLQQ
jgi:hypothetical protein